MGGNAIDCLICVGFALAFKLRRRDVPDIQGFLPSPALKKIRPPSFKGKEKPVINLLHVFSDPTNPQKAANP